MIAALFDLDGTLVSAQFGRGLLKYSTENGRNGLVRWYYASLVPDMLLSKVVPAARERFQSEIIARLPWLLKGLNREQVMKAFGWVATDYMLPTTRPETTVRLQEHLKQDHQVVIVSGVFESFLELVGARLGVEGGVGTKLAFKDGLCTGRLLSPVVKGEEKVNRIRRYFNDKGLDIDWESSYAYGDSFSDRGMLQLVGNPVAVHPDEKLRLLAVERGWEVLQSGDQPRGNS